MVQEEIGFRRKSLERKVYLLITAGIIGWGLYLSCNEPKGKLLEGFDPEAYHQSIIPSTHQKDF